jgi:hypothetical protein
MIQTLSQRDKRWGSIKLGTSDTTISGYGCTITCISMIIGTTPDVANERLKAVNGYAQGNLVIWDKLAEAFPGIKIKRVWSYDNADVLANVPNVLVEVDGKPIGGYRHWVVYIGSKKMIDPWDGTEKSTTSYPSPVSYCVILGKWNKPSPVSDDQKVIDELRSERDRNWWLYQAEIVKREEAEKQAQQANLELNGTNAILQSFRGHIRNYANLLNCKESETEKMAGEIKKLIDIETIYQEGEKTIKNLNIEVEGLKANELRLEDDLTRMADMKKEVDVELATCKTNNTNEGLSYYTWFTRFWSLFRVFFTRKAGE